MDKSRLTAYIKSLEETLLSVNVRKNPMELEKLIDDEFIEISKSGKIWTKQSLIENLQTESIKKITISDFSLKSLSDNIVLATYTAPFSL